MRIPFSRISTFLKSLVFLLLFATNTYSNQISIPRIDLMPDLPQPYLMRDWKQVAQGYDSLVFDKNLSGQYLPVVFFRESNINYPNHTSFGLHTAIGTLNPNTGEAINAIPAVVGASLSGIDKSNQFDQNWVLMCEEYFNKRPAENIYLNHPSSSSGNDWWYETMPNVFFMQLNYLYPHFGEFDYQVETIANQWLKATEYMGGSATPWMVPNMYYRAWSMATMTPLESGVKEPEAAGAIAWLLYHSYSITGNRKYLNGAEWSLDYLDSYEGNPSYELQLPYGAYTAARLNAEQGTNYDIEKMLNWCFNRGELRGWGAIVGKWGDYDCSGLIGEANDAGNDYAFAMNGYEHAGALVPLVRYDDRFATTIAKWVLNMANASRLFYSNYLPADMQDNEDWANTYDPDSYIAYESMKENKHDKSPYATGDAVDGGWASTNLMLYSSSHVGILGGIIDTTNIEGILQLDLLKTDYYGSAAYSTFLYFNPHELSKSIDINLPSGTFDLYDAISNTFLTTNISSTTSILIPPKESVMLVIIPSGASITINGKKTFANDTIIDFNNGAVVENFPPRIKALAAEDTLIEINNSFKIYCTATDIEQEIPGYEWTINGTTYDSSGVFIYNAPNLTGTYSVSCKVTDSGNLWDTLSITIKVVEKIMFPPIINHIEATPRKVDLMETSELICFATDANDDNLSYSWSSNAGSIQEDGISATFSAPGTIGNYFIICTVTDTDGLSVRDSIEIMVRDLSTIPGGNIIAHYPMNGNAFDASGNGFHGTAGGVNWGDDMNGAANKAVYFDGLNDYIHVSNNEHLNFQDAISIASWIYIDEFTSDEQYLLSHGNWDNRYKLSVSNKKLRFTLNTSSAIVDLDSDQGLVTGKWQHMAAIYDGSDMELWLDGKLNAFTPHTGKINKTGFDLAFGQYLPHENEYNFKGALDAVTIFDYPLNESQINDHYENAIDIVSTPLNKSNKNHYTIFPNPVTGEAINIVFYNSQSEDVIIQLYNVSGQQVISESNFRTSNGSSAYTLPVGNLKKGTYILSVIYNNQIENELIVIQN